jgi:hypothetical protein
MKFLVVLFALVAGCSIDHKSGVYACTQQSDCNQGRVCDNGFCVVQGSIDAPRPLDSMGHFDGAPNNCPPGCTSCNTAQHTCTIDCSLTSCNGKVTCPTGYACDIQCKTDNSCRNGVDCTLSTSCTVECSGSQSCRNVECGIGPCDVACSGASSCRGIACGNSCACDVTCTGNSSCADGIQCTSAACFSTSGGCTSVPTFCHSC